MKITTGLGVSRVWIISLLSITLRRHWEGVVVDPFINPLVLVVILFCGGHDTLVLNQQTLKSSVTNGNTWRVESFMAPAHLAFSSARNVKTFLVLTVRLCWIRSREGGKSSLGRLPASVLDRRLRRQPLKQCDWWVGVQMHFCDCDLPNCVKRKKKKGKKNEERVKPEFCPPCFACSFTLFLP